jgi:hypothetical protein
VLLVGDDSLEAHVGHLAALTGGEIFVSAGLDLPAMLEAAVRSLRSPHSPAELGSEMREQRAGMTLTARWSAGQAEGEPILMRAVAALAASIRLPALSAEEAGTLAEAEGLVTHLTSLILVDEDAAAQTGIPATRKIALPTPQTSLGVAYGAAPDARMRRLTGAGPSGAVALAALSEPPSARRVADAVRPRPEKAERRFGAAPNPQEEADALGPRKRSFLRRSGADPAAPEPDLGALAAQIDWGIAPQRLQGGDLSTVAPELARLIRDLAHEPFIVRAAEKIGCDPLVLVIALLARAASRRNRAARRLAQAILANRHTDDLEARLARHLRAVAPVS